jgi:hypothetical protein
MVLQGQKYLLPTSPTIYIISKGGHGAFVMIYGMSFLFISSHLPSSSVRKRRQAYEKICNNMSKELNIKNFNKFGIHGLFHGIVWVGDFNYRLPDITVEDCKELMFSVYFIYFLLN